MSLREEFPIELYNTLTRTKEKFEPQHEGHVGMYVCGPTVYNDVHLGNVRTFLSFDVINRYFRYLGYKVRYVRNITDVGHLENDADEGEDKIAKKARLEELEPMQVVQQYTNGFHSVLEEFNLLPPDIEPTATGHIIEQIEWVKTLLEKGLAYEVNGSVYFDVTKYNESHDYGKLSNRKIEELMDSGRMLDSQDEKRNKIDFAIWKNASPAHIMRWPSPWGDGFPGWHLECSVMSTKYLGETFDIHGGGMDLVFPHHECEIAQSVGCKGHDPAKYWLHTNMLTVEGQKMSKSLGNSFLPHELFTGNHPLLDRGYPPMVVRFFMLQSHYSSTLDFSNEALGAAERGYKRLMEGFKTARQLEYTPGAVDTAFDTEVNAQIDAIFKNLSDDFNTAKALASLFDLTSVINNLKTGNKKTGALSKPTFERLITHYTGIITDVLGLKSEQESNSHLLDGTLDVLINLRTDAKRQKNYALADQIRDDLKRIGITLKDGKDGTEYSID
ncbi:cysteine--tRNA ligase [Fulvivirga sedimenti]|uniref:Cysteine--tRNA ligase n=1 Tax=Fulvivirga sedimenti TaxID=2879465 RepID=A0A9X1HPW5_9BACT|nr:cysteine--tRNA ligase [Fulvivirga sedimenti]MCA6074961.1 cysteine--tRNA ligase [Fulvivirga sedimenti]MCA6076138.1 cysteine--tRNA ligase [Fulvivirga sedimenti]MCA6077266.1 cysteine--tRNA ligase [Fulvivirga sedimenti]